MKLLAAGRQRSLPKGQALNAPVENSPLYLLQSGYVKRYRIMSDGSQSIQGLYGPKDVFPITPAIKLLLQQDVSQTGEDVYYQAVTPVTFTTISPDSLVEAVVEDPIVFKDVLSVTGVRLNSCIQQIENISLGYSITRVAHQLVYLAESFGEQTDDGGVKILVPLTHQDIAAIVNLARETVTNSMLRLRSRGLIAGDQGQYIIVPDLQALKDSIRQ